MIHNPIPGAAVVSRSQVYQLYPGHLALANLTRICSRLEKAPQHIHGSIPQNILGFKINTHSHHKKKWEKVFYCMMCILLFLCLRFFLKTGTPFFPSCIRKKVFVMLLVVLCFHCVVTLERLSVESLGFTGTKETWLMSCVEKGLFPQVGRLPRVLEVTALQRSHTEKTISWQRHQISITRNLPAIFCYKTFTKSNENGYIIILNLIQEVRV